MKIVIAHSTTKRQIDGDFELCGTKDDLRSMAKQILDQTQDFGYGWIWIVDRVSSSVFTNCPPKGWDQ